jgi:hypothetical protein
MATTESITLELEDCHLLALQRAAHFYLRRWTSATNYLDPEPTKFLKPQVYIQLLTNVNERQKEKRVLSWQPFEEKRDYPLVAYLGNYPGGDGVMFSLEYFATCYRRGKYRLIIEVASGPMHEAWGCFDDQDQPMRYFHKQSNALDEAEQIARILLQGRFDHGPIHYDIPE